MLALVFSLAAAAAPPPPACVAPDGGRLVLELAAGAAAKHRITTGSVLRCSGVPGFPSEALPR